jgi:Xaa-Pro aminopeptidase
VGARVDGYCSDMTRTVVVPGAPPSGEARRVGAVVARALEAGLRALRAGVPGVAVDRAARAVIEGEGFGEAFEHSTGHGVGLEVHEPPRLGPSAPSRARVPAGAVVTVEPGVYLPGRLGVRLEELAWVGPDGPETLSRAPLGIW